MALKFLFLILGILIYGYESQATTPQLLCARGLLSLDSSFQDGRHSVLSDLNVYTSAFKGRFRVPGRHNTWVSAETSARGLFSLRLWIGPVSTDVQEFSYGYKTGIKEVIKATFQMGDRFFVMLGDERAQSMTTEGVRLLGFDLKATGLTSFTPKLKKVVETRYHWDDFSRYPHNVTERFIAFKIQQDRGETEVVPAIVHIDETGRSIFRFDRDGKMITLR